MSADTFRQLRAARYFTLLCAMICDARFRRALTSPRRHTYAALRASHYKRLRHIRVTARHYQHLRVMFAATPLPVLRLRLLRRCRDVLRSV